MADPISLEKPFTENQALANPSTPQVEKEAIALSLFAQALSIASHDEDDPTKYGNKITPKENSELNELAEKYLGQIADFQISHNFSKLNLETYTEQLFVKFRKTEPQGNIYTDDARAFYAQAKEAVQFSSDINSAFEKVEAIRKDLTTHSYSFEKRIKLFRELSLYFSYARNVSTLHQKLHASPPFMKKTVDDAEKRAKILEESLHYDGGTDEKGNTYGLYRVYKNTYDEIRAKPAAEQDQATVNYLLYHLNAYKRRGAEKKESKVTRAQTIGEIEKLTGDIQRLFDEIEKLPRDFEIQISVEELRAAPFTQQTDSIKSTLLKDALTSKAKTITINLDNYSRFIEECLDAHLLFKVDNAKKEIYRERYLPKFEEYKLANERRAILSGYPDIISYTLSENHDYKTRQEVEDYVRKVTERYFNPELKKLGYTHGVNDARLPHHRLDAIYHAEEARNGIDASLFPKYLGFKENINNALKDMCFFLSSSEKGKEREVAYRPYTLAEINADEDLKRFLSWNLKSWDPEVEIPIIKIFDKKTGQELSTLVLDLFKRAGDKATTHPTKFSYIVPKQDGSIRLINVLNVAMKPGVKNFLNDYQLSNTRHELGHVMHTTAAFDQSIYPELAGPTTTEGQESLGNIFERLTYDDSQTSSLIDVNTQKPAPQNIKDAWVKSPEAFYGVMYSFRGLIRNVSTTLAYELGNTEQKDKQLMNEFFNNGYFITRQKGDTYVAFYSVLNGRNLTEILRRIKKQFPVNGREVGRNLFLKHMFSNNKGLSFGETYKNLLQAVKALGINVDDLSQD